MVVFTPVIIDHGNIIIIIIIIIIIKYYYVSVLAIITISDLGDRADGTYVHSLASADDHTLAHKSVV